MSTLLLIQLPGGQWIALSPEAFAQAIAAAEAVMPIAKAAATDSNVELIDASTAATRFGIKKSWLLEQARLNKIPHVRLGKYVRFSLSAIAAHLARGSDQRLGKPCIAPKPMNGNGL